MSVLDDLRPATAQRHITGGTVIEVLPNGAVRIVPSGAVVSAGTRLEVGRRVLVLSGVAFPAPPISRTEEV